MPRIDQILAGFAEGDAISREAVQLRNVFRKLGAESDIFADPGHVAPESRGQVKALREYAGGPSDIAIHHYAIASPAGDLFLSSPGKKVLVYHNITPAEFFRGFDDGMADKLRHARQDLGRVAAGADAVWAVSEFNAEELRELGIPNVRVLPLSFSPASLDIEPDPRVLARFSPPMANILFVGRVAPNKCIEELILAFAWYHRTINANSRLVIVGSDRSCPRYFAMLRLLAGELDLANVCFECFASPAGLVAYYHLASVFVSVSRHEGYCLPLVEAMFMGVPVIARNIGGVPEAMGGAGILFDDLEPRELAELIHRVASPGPLREQVLASQGLRMEAMHDRRMEDEVKTLLSAL